MSHPSLPPIPALEPRGPGHQFVCYADSCSGIPGALHETTFAAVNAVIQRLDPAPEFIAFPGDEIMGLIADGDELRRQWRHWRDVEMGWLDRAAIPIYHTTGNHTAYDPESTAIFQEMLPELPRNGPPGQEGLSYVVRRGDLVMVFINTLTVERGGEGFVETDWLDQALVAHADARFKMVFGHHPVFPVNGFSGPYQREIGEADGRALWQTLIRHRVLAYWCSHILAFDVQVHQGVLQILTAGAGTAHRMPEGIEYLHGVQAALDEGGLRYQVLDDTGVRRESLSWPFALPPSSSWQQVHAPDELRVVDGSDQLVVWDCSGVCADDGLGTTQTLVAGWPETGALPSLWIGLTGGRPRLTILLSPQVGRSPHRWHGPEVEPGQPFRLQLAMHPGMGPGGMLWRRDETDVWTSLQAASPWGIERLAWPRHWAIGRGARGVTDQPYRGGELRIAWHVASLTPLN